MTDTLTVYEDTEDGHRWAQDPAENCGWMKAHLASGRFRVVDEGLTLAEVWRVPPGGDSMTPKEEA
jgi:hypothetical protein